MTSILITSRSFFPSVVLGEFVYKVFYEPLAFAEHAS